MLRSSNVCHDNILEVFPTVCLKEAVDKSRSSDESDGMSMSKVANFCE